MSRSNKGIRDIVSNNRGGVTSEIRPPSQSGIFGAAGLAQVNNGKPKLSSSKHPTFHYGHRQGVINAQIDEYRSRRQRADHQLKAIRQGTWGS